MRLVPLGQPVGGAGIAGEPANSVGTVGDNGRGCRPLGVSVKRVASEQRPGSAIFSYFGCHASSFAASQW